ncbi:MAG: EsaB/YukD family protein [Clostridia bacterium]|nr:EsaB/YukD family protein [Clostridia bacterium]
MENIIVTVTNLSQSFLYDIEVPTSVPVGKLKDDIVEALNGYDSALCLRTEITSLFCNRMGRSLTDDETFESAGVWNGDYITMIGDKNGRNYI